MSVSSNWQALLKKQKEEGAITPPANTNGKKRPRVDRGPQTPVADPKKQAALDKKSVLTASNQQRSGISDVVAMDCEMVGVGHGGAESVLARCSIVNLAGDVLYDKYVKPREEVTDYRTHVSGIRPEHVHGPHAIDFAMCQSEVAAILKGRILVGHAITNDLDVLVLSHPRHMIRDTARFKVLCPQRPRALRKLVAEKLNITVQDGEHDSVEDARCVMALYRMYRKEWEDMLRKHGGKLQGKMAGKAARLAASCVPAGTTVSTDETKTQAIQTPTGGVTESKTQRTILHAKRKHGEQPSKHQQKPIVRTMPVKATTSSSSSLNFSIGGVRPTKRAATKGSTSAPAAALTAQDRKTAKLKAKLMEAKKRPRLE